MQNNNIYISVGSDRYSTLINQTGVKHHLLPSPSEHNASWDAIILNDGDVLISLCSELTTSEYAKLLRFDKVSKNFKVAMDIKSLFFTQDRTIRDSKIHTCMSEMEDGKIIMCTHTTDKAPEHPAWLPHAYYNNPWTGYAGSHVMIYDPISSQTEYLGIPVPRETLYGGVYHKKTGLFYCLGYIKGHLYSFNPVSKEVHDYGQIVERSSYRLHVGPDDNIYFTTRNGVLLKLDIVKNSVINLGFEMPFDGHLGKPRGYSCFMTNGPDNKMYIASMYTDQLSRYNPIDNTFEVLGRYKEEDYYTDSSPSFDHVGAMGFDKFGCLYLAICPIRHDNKENFKMGSSLIRWDVINGGNPEFLGILGSEEKAIVTTCSLLMNHESDIMYIVQTNHGNDSPDILEIDLSVYRNHCLVQGPKCKDVFINPMNTKYRDHNDTLMKTFHIWNTNPYYALMDRVTPIAVWKDLKLDPGCVTIIGVRVENTIHVELSDGQYAIYTVDGTLIERGIRTEYPMHQRVASVDGFKLPFSYPGRQYLSTKRDIINLRNGDRIMVTNDGLLVVELKGSKSLRNYGPIWVNGQLVSWLKLNRKDVIYGVAGDKDDLHCLFRFTVETGIEWLGYLGCDSERGAFNSPKGGSIVVDSRDRTLVVASKTTLPVIYVYNLQHNISKDSK